MSISAGLRGLQLLQSVSPVASPLPALDDARLPLTSPYPSGAVIHGHFMIIIVTLIILTFVLMAVFSLRVHHSAISWGGDVGNASVAASPPSPQGLDRGSIDKLPVAVFHEEVTIRVTEPEKCDSIGEDASQGAPTKDDAGFIAHHDRKRTCRAECAICLTEFRESECIRMLPRCEHCFHTRCIDVWLFTHSTCPLCRSNLLRFPAEASPSNPPRVSQDSES
ncbi:hypothetical protein KP509_29G079600 [Ceratopteris richardii]|uniref:RING-type E3 ubiquitin transferase n=3 Tax=Ceratopteris richardii TaxID=49495 RepID=A0A8T2RA60_CERRI|nr:hypothetical protein KP509_29G079600 [Ceratopteris richardii]